MRTIITTVGTSLLTNRDGRPWSKEPLPDPGEVAAWLKTADPCHASAELHTWFRLGLFKQPASERVRLIHSHTPDGRFCAECLRDYAQHYGLDAALVDITELHYTDAANFNRGLRQLVHVLAEQIRAATHSPQDEVALAATGGFKAEIAVANLVGALLGAPVYYIYEQFQQLIKLEPLPIALQGDWLRQGPGEKLLQTLAADEIVPRQQVRSLLQADPRLELLLEAEEVGGQLHVAPNLLGEFAVQLFQTPPVGWPPECETPPMDKVQLEGAAHHRPTGWKETVHQIARNIYVQRIRYDAGAGQRAGLFPSPDNDCDLYGVLNDGRYWLGLRIETTAENAEQRRRVLDYLRQQLKW